PFDADANLEPQVIENLKAAYDLDKPLIQQYVIYLGKVFQGDFGPSIIYQDRTVSQLIATGLPVSLKVGLTAVLFAGVIGIALGIVAALNQNKITDYAVMGA